MDSRESKQESNAEQTARLHTQRRYSIERTREMRGEIERLMGPPRRPAPKKKRADDARKLDQRPRPA